MTRASQAADPTFGRACHFFRKLPLTSYAYRCRDRSSRERQARQINPIDTMKIKIKETGELKELSIVDPATGIPFTGDFIGNTGATSDGQFTLDRDEGVYLCSEETFAWWEACLAAHQGMEDRLHALRQEHGSDAVFEVVHEAGGGCDLEDEPKVILAALAERFGS